MEPFIAQIMLFGGNFAPRGWAFCHGQLLPISQNTALFSLIGTTYGGDGRTTFGLPDLRGRVPLTPGQGPGLPNITWGQRGGVAEVTLNKNQMPSHTHTAENKAVSPISRGGATESNPTGAYNAEGGVYAKGAANAKMAADSVSVSPTGGNQAHTNMQPFLGVSYVIALQGIFPSRS